MKILYMCPIMYMYSIGENLNVIWFSLETVEQGNNV